MISRMGQATSLPGTRPRSIYGAPPVPVIIATPPILEFARPRRGGWTPATTRPVRPWINRAGLGELDYSGSWEQPLLDPTPLAVVPVAPARPVTPPGPILLGSPPGGGYTWQLADGSIVTTPTSDPPRPMVMPLPGIQKGDDYGDMLARPAICPPWCGPGGSVGIPDPGGYREEEGATDAWIAQTPSPPPPGQVPPLTPGTSPGTLPPSGYVIAPNFSDPAGVGGPFTTAGVEVVAGMAAPAPAVSPWVWVGAAVLGVMLLGGGAGGSA